MNIRCLTVVAVLGLLLAWPAGKLAQAAGGAAQAGKSKVSSSGVELSDALYPGNKSIQFDIKWADGTPLKLNPQEEVAFLFVTDVYMLEDTVCNLRLNRYCSIPELVKGVKTSMGLQGLTRDPAQDANYRYTFTTSGHSIQVAATPRRPGLGGWLYVETDAPSGLAETQDIHYNPTGPATTNDKTISKDSSALGGDFQRQ